MTSSFSSPISSFTMKNTMKRKISSDEDEDETDEDESEDGFFENSKRQRMNEYDLATSMKQFINDNPHVEKSKLKSKIMAITDTLFNNNNDDDINTKINDLKIINHDDDDDDMDYEDDVIRTVFKDDETENEYNNNDDNDEICNYKWYKSPAEYYKQF